jgi:glycosyltransferase involved in cell wall biosynthesis
LLANGIGTSDSIACVYNGLDVEAFDACASLGRAELGLAESDYVIGCIDRVTRQKNQTTLLRALALLGIDNWRLLLVGGGEMAAEVDALARELGIRDRIAWIHQVGNARPYYAACDMIAHPSLWDSCPYTVLEAMAAARPVVAGDVGGVPELLGSTGRLHDPGDCNLLATLLEELGENRELARSLGTAARERLMENFQLTAMVEETIAVYEGMLRG